MICDIHYAKLVTDEAKRLNMLDGHFFWLWIDASKDFDGFYDIINKTDNNPENENEGIKDIIERSKRDDVNNNTKKVLDVETKNVENINNFNLSYINIKNYTISLNFISANENINSSKNRNNLNKLLDINISQKYYNITRRRTTRIKNNYNVNNKGVETSKTENNSIVEEKVTFDKWNSSNQISDRKTKNESFNKYVNSIYVGDTIVVKNPFLERDAIISEEKNNRDKNSVLSSDILMNPEVHAAIMHNLRNNIIDKRSNKYITTQETNNEEHKIKNNITVIYNSLPVGLLALHPQPMKIG